MNDNFLSSFTPSLMSAETLEKIFVQRHKLVEDLTESVIDSVETANKHFRLLIGMRGIGKTHIVALIYHRLKAKKDLQNNLAIAWLKEEEWGVSSWLDLLLRILQALATEYPIEYQNKLRDRVETLYELPAEDATRQAEKILQEFVGNKTLLLLTENLDDIFIGLGNIGQKQFRAYLQNHNFITVIATSQSLFNAVSNKTSPFYGFFSPQYLKKLTLEEATNLLANIARLQQDTELETFIGSATGKNRIKAIHHLAGGNHRVYIIFSQFLSRNSLDELVKPVMQTLDELTPYYQARMQWLSPQQRKIIELLCDRASALPVKEIARRCFITHQTASSQLKDLRTKSYVSSESIGRESFYELQEPLMRICLEVKKQRGEPIKLFIDFLRIWYTERELRERLKTIPESCLEREYINHALDTKNKLTSSDFEKNTFIIENLIDKGIEEGEAGNLETALKLFDKAIEIDFNNVLAWYNRGIALGMLERFDDAVFAFSEALKIDNGRVLVWLNYGYVLDKVGELENAIISYNKALSIQPKMYNAWNYRGISLCKLGRFEEAIESYNEALKIEPNFDAAWYNFGYALAQIENYNEAISAYDKALVIQPERHEAWGNRAVALEKLEQLEEAIVSYDRALAIQPNNYNYWINRGVVLGKLGRFEDAIASYDKALSIEPNIYEPWYNRGVDFLELNKFEEAIESYNKALAICPDKDLIWHNRGVALYQIGRYEEALDSYNKAISFYTKYSIAFLNRTELLFKLNRWEEGFNALDEALNQYDNVEKQKTEDIIEYVKIIYLSTTNDDILKTRIKTLVETYNNRQAVSTVNKGVLYSIVISGSDSVSNKLARSWLKIWQEVGADKPELEIALRLLKTAVEYKESKGDRKVLLQLAKEEREILESLLNKE